MRASVSLALAVALLTACSQGAGYPAIPGTPLSHAAQTVPVSVTVRVPHPTGRRPDYVSPATKSVSIVVTPNDGTALPAAILNCVTGTCSGTLAVPIGTNTFAVSAFDRSGADGNLLSQGSVEQTILVGKANTVRIVLSGVPARASLTLTPPLYTYQSSGRVKISLTAYDIDGYAIAGRYSPPLTITDSDKSGYSALSRTGIGSSTATVTLSYSPNFAGATIGAKSSRVPTVTKFLGPLLDDDWPTFAHDEQRTGFETLPTGITKTTVSQLKLAWAVNPDKSACTHAAVPSGNLGDEAAPLVWGGLVYVANTCGAVYALARSDGHTVWHTALPLTGTDPASGVFGTPALDPIRGILLVPVWGTAGVNCPGTSCVPAYGGYLAALDAKTGAVDWKSAPLALGNIRGEPLALNGVVYLGKAGGDVDSGYVQGGMMEFDESTGTQLPGYFQVAKPGSTNDGGASWSPISYDGTDIYFGTGNTANNDGDFDGVVKLDPASMTPLKSYGTYPDNNSYDGDVGGGELLYGGNMYFSSKNGYYYGFLLAGFPTPLFSPAHINKNPVQGNGGIGTPTTDGNVISVSSGYNTTMPSPLTSDLDIFPIGGGTQKCTLKPNPASAYTTANSSIHSYAAWVSGVGFLGMDNGLDPGTKPEFYAFDDNCSVVWTAPGIKGFFYAGPAIVQSGVYAADGVGNVYAWKLPATMGIDADGRRVPAQRTNPSIKLFIHSRHFLPDKHGVARARPR